MHPFFYESIFNLISGTGSLQVLLKGIWKYPILHNINYRLSLKNFRPACWLTSAFAKASADKVKSDIATRRYSYDKSDIETQLHQVLYR